MSTNIKFGIRQAGGELDTSQISLILNARVAHKRPAFSAAPFHNRAAKAQTIGVFQMSNETNEVPATISEAVKYTLPTDKAKREELAKAAGFASIAEAREGTKSKDAAIVTAAKAYAKSVKDSAEVAEATLVYPNAAALKPEEIQELIASTAKGIQYSAILAARRKGEGMAEALALSLNIYDLTGGAGEDDGDLDGEAVKAALETFVKANGFNEVTSLIVTAAVRGSKSQMLKLRKYFDNMERAQAKFSSWVADQADVDLDNVVAWMKQQAKRLNAARATPEIDESAISI